MKLFTERERKSFVNTINKLREETGHQHSFISRWMYENLKWIWINSKNPKEAKEWFKVDLGW